MCLPFPRLIALILTFVVLFTACGVEDGANQVIKCDIATGVTNLDPQFATDETARMIISNTFEGLFRQLPNGSVEPAIARDYTVSEDGLTYTFNLREDVYWSPKNKKSPAQPVTAEDFVFAFQRIFNPFAPSPFATNLMSIANAGRVLESTYPISMLGVTALDKYTLCIKLERQETLLPTLLAETYAIPCNEVFFNETRGRYGLQSDMLLYNGPFRITRWNNESGISLRRNAEYYREVIAAGVEFNIPTAIARTAENNFISDRTERFLSGNTDVCKIDYNLKSKVIQSGGTVTEFEDTVWVLALNMGTKDNPGRFASVDLRQAVAYSVDRSLFTELPENMRPTNTLIPPAITSNGRSFREIAGSLSPLAYSPDLARRSYHKERAELGEIPLSLGQILISDDPAQSIVAGYLLRNLQQQLAAPVGITRVTKDELLQRVKNGDYSAAVFPLSAAYSSPDAMLSYFRSDSPMNFTGFANETFDSLLKLASTLSAGERDEVYSQAEQLLLTQCPVIPLFYETSCHGAAKGVSGIGFAPFLSGMRFQDARKIS